MLILIVRTQWEGALDYEFILFPKEGAVLILPEGAEHHVLRNESIFLNHAIQYGASWYRFAQERRGWLISRDSLYLITGFHKARSWSLAAYENATAKNGFSARFRATQVGEDDIDIGTAYTWRTPRALNRRVGPIGNYGMPNQAVFIRGFKIALRTGLPGMNRVTVKAGAPSARSMHANFSSSVFGKIRLANTSSQTRSASTSGTGKRGSASKPGSRRVLSTPLDEEALGAPMEVRRLPEVSRVSP